MNLDTTLDAEEVSPTDYDNPEEAVERLRAEAWGEEIPVDPALVAQALGIRRRLRRRAADAAEASRADAKEGLREVEMAVRFGVSREAMHLRLVNLDLI